MARVAPIYGNFNAGEFSPLLYGRVDAERYKAGLAVCYNMIPTLQGGLVRRPGTKFVDIAKEPSEKARLIPFTFSTTQSYMLEFGPEYIRFYTNYGQVISGYSFTVTAANATAGATYQNNGATFTVLSTIVAGTSLFTDSDGGPTPTGTLTLVTGTGDATITFSANAPIPLEVATPYFDDEWLDVSYTQSNDVLYLVHKKYPPAKLQRFGPTNWIYTKLDILDGPYLNEQLGSTDVSVTAITVSTTASPITNAIVGPGTTIIITCANHGFITGDVVLISNIQGTAEANGLWTVTFIGTGVFTISATFVNAYISGGIAQRFIGYGVGGSNAQLSVTVSLGDMTINVSSVTILGAVNNGSGLIRITTSLNHFYETGDTVVITGILGTTEANGTWVIIKVNDTKFDLKASAFVNAYVSGGTSKLGLFVSTDVGRNIRIREILTDESDNWQWGTIITYNSPVQVVARIRSDGFNSTTLDGLSYRLGAWSDTTGYPSRIVFHEDRLCFAGSPNFPQRLDMSKSGDYENFAPSFEDGVIADDFAVSVTLNSNDVNAIQWMTSDERGLPIGTTGGEWVIRPSSLAEAITPGNISAKRVSTFGSASRNAVVVGKSSIYVQAGTTKVRELNYFYNIDGFRSTDLTMLAEHVTGTGISSDFTFQKLPQPIVWGARNDGVMIGMTFERELDALKAGWHRHILGGFSDVASHSAQIESVAVIPSPSGDRDDVWLSVKRYINGQEVRYIEYMTKIFQTNDKQQDAFFVDCGATYDLPLTVTGITQANPCVVTSIAHGLTNGETVVFRDLNGMNQLNGNIYTVANVAANTFELTDSNGNNIDSTSFAPFVYGGTVRKRILIIDGLDWLEGETLSVLGDGAVQPDVVVGAVGPLGSTLQPAIVGRAYLEFYAATVQIGYGYNSDIQLLRAEAGSVNGTSIGKERRTHEVSVMLERSLGMKLGMSFDKLDTITFRTTADLMTHAPSLFSGIIRQRIEATFNTENQVCIRQDQPLPLMILAVMPQMVTEDQL